VKASYELTLLDRYGEIIRATAEGIYNFSSTSDRIDMTTLTAVPELEDAFHVRCDVTVVEVTAVEPLFLHGNLANLLGSKVGCDVTFEVASELFTAHKIILAARSGVFMAEFFGPGKENAAATRVRIDDMEPKVFKALLHFIYTDTLPKINKGDEVAMAIGLLVAAKRYGVNRLGSICEDIFFFYADARTAVATLELADKHGCHRLRNACIKSLKDLLAKEEAKMLYYFLE
jgi:speckle-type POZ protein